MSISFGLRARLTVVVTLVFAAAIALIAVVLVEYAEDRLVEDTRTNAEAVLGDYLDRLYGGEVGVGIVGVEEGTGFFYLDAAGEPLSAVEFLDDLEPGVDVAHDESASPPPDSEPHSGSVDNPAHPAGDVIVETPPDAVAVEIFPTRVGDPVPVDLGDDVVAVAQTLRIGNEVVRVGVSSPLRPVHDSLDTIRGLLSFVLPVLVVGVAAVSWLTANRVLRPVDLLTKRVQAITHQSLGERLPVRPQNDEIGRLATTMNDMLERLDRSQQLQRQLVSDASHELRSPIAVSRAQLDVALSQPDSTDWSKTAKVVLAEQEHLTHLVDDLLQLSRLDEFGVEAPVDIDLDDLVASEADRPWPTSPRVTIPDPVRVLGDRPLLTRAVRNLIDNATRHARSDVQVTLTTSDDQAIVTVDDDGPGIDPEDRERVFERFTRLDEARHGGGSGLGLAIARQVARSHGGDLTTGDGPLAGAQFTLSLPLEDDNIPQPSA